MPQITIIVRNDQLAYLKKMARSTESSNESEMWRVLIDSGIARREEAIGVANLTKLSAHCLTLLRRIAAGIDESLIDISKQDAEKILESLSEG
jgi:hypothetical protein